MKIVASSVAVALVSSSHIYINVIVLSSDTVDEASVTRSRRSLLESSATSRSVVFWLIFHRLFIIICRKPPSIAFTFASNRLRFKPALPICIDNSGEGGRQGWTVVGRGTGMDKDGKEGGGEEGG